MAKKINRKTKSYFVKKNSFILLLENDVKNSTKELPQPVGSYVAEKTFGFDRSFLVMAIEDPRCNSNDKLYLFRHMTGLLMLVREEDIIKTNLSVPKWCKKNKHLLNDISPGTYIETRP